MKIESTIIIDLTREQAGLLYKILGKQSPATYNDAGLSEVEGEVLGSLYYLLDKELNYEL